MLLQWIVARLETLPLLHKKELNNSNKFQLSNLLLSLKRAQARHPFHRQLAQIKDSKLSLLIYLKMLVKALFTSLRCLPFKD